VLNTRNDKHRTPDAERACLERQLADHKTSAERRAMEAACLGAEVQRLRRELDRANRCIACLRDRLAESDPHDAAAEGKDHAPTLCSH